MDVDQRSRASRIHSFRSYLKRRSYIFGETVIDGYHKDSGRYIYTVLRFLHNYDQRLQSSFDVITQLTDLLCSFYECQRAKHDKEHADS